jgi:hypothetical protein
MLMSAAAAHISHTECLRNGVCVCVCVCVWAPAATTARHLQELQCLMGATSASKRTHPWIGQGMRDRMWACAALY